MLHGARGCGSYKNCISYFLDFTVNWHLCCWFRAPQLRKPNVSYKIGKKRTYFSNECFVMEIEDCPKFFPNTRQTSKLSLLYSNLWEQMNVELVKGFQVILKRQIPGIEVFDWYLIFFLNTHVQSRQHRSTAPTISAPILRAFRVSLQCSIYMKRVVRTTKRL